MGQRPTVRWNESKQRWMAWVRFPDGSRRKVERATKADAQRDLDALLTRRAQHDEPDEPRLRGATFAVVIEAWFDDGCQNASPTSRSRHARTKSPNTISNARQLLRCHVLPELGQLRVERVATERLESLFQAMADKDYATSTVDRTWHYLNQACEYGLRRRMISNNPAAGVLLPAVKPSKERKSLTVELCRPRSYPNSGRSVCDRGLRAGLVRVS